MYNSKEITVRLVNDGDRYLLCWMNIDFKNPDEGGSYAVTTTEFSIPKYIYDSLYLLN